MDRRSVTECDALRDPAAEDVEEARGRQDGLGPWIALVLDVELADFRVMAEADAIELHDDVAVERFVRAERGESRRRQQAHKCAKREDENRDGEDEPAIGLGRRFVRGDGGRLFEDVHGSFATSMSDEPA